MESNQNALSCEYCGKSYSTKSNLTHHQKTAKKCLTIQEEHNNKPDEHVCEYCEKSFSSHSTLVRHQKTTKSCYNKTQNIEREITTFICNGCEKLFTTKTNLNTHTSICISLKQKDLEEKYKKEILELTTEIKQLVITNESTLREKTKLEENYKNEIKELHDKYYQEVKELRQSLELCRIDQNIAMTRLNDTRDQLLKQEELNKDLQDKILSDRNALRRVMMENVRSFKRFESLEKYDKKCVCYIGFVRNDNEENNYEYIKFGESSTLKSRVTTHKREFENFDLVYVKECHNSRDIEDKFKNYLKDKKLLVRFTSKEKEQTEIFKITNEDIFNNALTELERLVNNERNSMNDMFGYKMKIQELELSNIIAELEKKELEYKLKDKEEHK